MKPHQSRSLDDLVLDLRQWAIGAKAMINNGTFSPKREYRIVKLLCKEVERHKAEAFYLGQRVLEAASKSLLESPASAKIVLPKMTKYYAECFLSYRHWYAQEYLLAFVQYCYRIFAGRLLTPLGGIRLYLTFASTLTISFALMYYIGDMLSWTAVTSHNITFLHCIYFSAVTLTTLGYGDIHVATTTGIWLAIVEVFLGYLLLALAVHAVTTFLSPLPKQFMPEFIHEKLEDYLNMD